jgi:acetyl-CoA carboxylase carboxyltransferase component
MANQITKTFAWQLLARMTDHSELFVFRAMYADALVCGWKRHAPMTYGLRAAAGEIITAEELGGATTHCRCVCVYKASCISVVCPVRLTTLRLSNVTRLHMCATC